MRDEPICYRFELDRRGFLGVTGAGLMISASRVTFSQSRRSSDSSVAARVHIAPDGRITIMTSKVEVGQGSRAQITQAAAEELKVPVDQITLIMGDTDLTPDDGGTAGSRTTPSTVPAVRQGTAAAREILAELACRRWQVDRGSVQVKRGTVVHSASGRSLSYAELARSTDLREAFETIVPNNVRLTPVEEWEVLGTSVLRPNGRDIVTGAHRYPSDIVRANMLYGKVLRPSSYDAVLTEVDLSSAKRMPGVVAVRDGNFVGCAAETSYRATRAVDALAKTATWKGSPHPPSKELFSYIRKKSAPAERGGRRPRIREAGSLREGLAGAQKVLKATYETAYIQHAPMEPRAAVAEWENGRVTVWTGTQQPARVRRELARAFHISEDQVRVIVPDTGGGFGGKHTGETAVEAARLAKAAGRPVSLRWTREEEFTWAYFRPAALIDVTGGIDDRGKLMAWEFVNMNSGASAMSSPYEIPHRREEFRECDSPLREGSYRVLAATANNFARESFMDELAFAAGQDPLDFRLAHMKDERLRAVLEAAAERFDWRQRRKNRSAGRGWGLACGTEKGSYTAACVEARVDGDEIRVTEVCQAFECGAIQNPDNLRAQAQGCVIMTLGGALMEEIQFEEGRILNARFSQYRVPRFKDIPRIETVLLNRPDLPSAGAGETPMIDVPPAVANAVFDASSIRLRSLPMLRIE